MSENHTSEPPLFTRAQANQIADTARIAERKYIIAAVRMWAQDNLSPEKRAELMEVIGRTE